MTATAYSTIRHLAHELGVLVKLAAYSIACPFGHSLEGRVQYRWDDSLSCDMCKRIIGKDEVYDICTTCNNWQLCSSCRYGRISRVWDILRSNGPYDLFSLARCESNYVMRSSSRPASGKCSSCPATSSIQWFACGIRACTAGFCLLCYRERTRARPKRQRFRLVGCTTCVREKTRYTDRIRINTRQATLLNCSACGVSICAKTAFMCDAHSQSKICARCMIKESRGVDPRIGSPVVMYDDQGRIICSGFNYSLQGLQRSSCSSSDDETPTPDPTDQSGNDTVADGAESTARTDSNDDLGDNGNTKSYRTRQSTSAARGSPVSDSLDIEEAIKMIQCPICMARKKNRVFSCGHAFCNECIDLYPRNVSWLECPVCKQRVLRTERLHL